MMRTKNLMALFLMGIGTLSLFSQTEKTKPETFEEKFSYAVGYDVTQSLVKMHASLDKSWMMKGIVDAFADSSGNPLITQEEMELVFQEFQRRKQMQDNKDAEGIAKSNRDQGMAFIEKQMAANPKMKKTSTGLVYLPIKEGKGKNPTAENTVSVKYSGALIDGSVFDQSGDNPITFKLTEVIPGWTEGLQLMKPGATYQLIIPAELAYGNNPPPGTPIQPGSTLVFTVELVKIEK